MSRSITALVVLVVTGVALACSPPSAEDLVRDVIAQRNNYDATLQSWNIIQGGVLYMDVMVVNNNQEGGLAALTVLVEQLDVDDNSLATSRVAMDTTALTAGLGQSIGVRIANPAPGVEGVRLLIEPDPEREIWPEFREFDRVRPRG